MWQCGIFIHLFMSVLLNCGHMARAKCIRCLLVGLKIQQAIQEKIGGKVFCVNMSILSIHPLPVQPVVINCTSSLQKI